MRLRHRFRDPELGYLAWRARLARLVMFATFKWIGSTSRGNQLTTELNALANGAFSAVGPAYDNRTNLDEYAYCDIVLASLNPAAGGHLQLFLVVSTDGTNYEDAASATNPGSHQRVWTVSLTTGAGAKRISVPRFEIPPLLFKFVLKNGSGVALGATLNTVAMTTGNEQSV